MGDGAGAAKGGRGNAMDEDEEEEPRQVSETALDDNDRLFATGEYDAEDKQADLVYASFDDYMDSRRKRQREEREMQEAESLRAKRPKLATQFADEKRSLTSVSSEEWSNLPVSGDSRARAPKWERLTPAPESLLESAHRQTQMRGSVSAFEASPSSSGTASVFASATPLTDVQAVGMARQAVLGTQLDSISKSVISGTVSTVQSREGYLSVLDTSLQNQRRSTAMGDSSSNRAMLESATQSNPFHAPSWISLARLEEDTGRLKKAIKAIESACINCPKNKDVWLEAARLNPTTEAKSILAQAVQHLPDEVDIWLAAAQLEAPNVERQRRVYQRALERIPNSVELWKEAISKEAPDEARVLLAQAVICVPHSAQMWLALAHLETYDKAKIVLNTARKALPREKLIWIAAAQLEETAGHTSMVRTIIQKAISSLEARQVTLSRAEWLAEAERCEEANSPETCIALVYETVGRGLDPNDYKSVWIEDAKNSASRGRVVTARAILTNASKVLAAKKSIWRELAFLEKSHGTRENMLKVLEQAVEHCPKAEYLWVLAAKEEFIAGNLDSARKIIAKAYTISPDSEQIWLAASKIEQQDRKFEAATKLLSLARQKAPSPKVWMKSAMLQRQMHSYASELALLEEGTKLYPDFAKLWMMLGQFHERKQAREKESSSASKDASSASKEPFSASSTIKSASSASMPTKSLMGPPQLGMGLSSSLNGAETDLARGAYAQGLKHCPGSIPLWLCAIRYEERINGANSARAMCERGRLKIQNAPELWTEAVRIERRSGQTNAAKMLCSRALQQYGTAGSLWIELIELEVKPADKASRFSDAFKNCDSDPNLIAAGARIFAETRKIKNAREWFERAVKTSGVYGDVWASYFKFELHHGTEEQRAAIVRRCVEAAPRYGEKWTSIAKDPENVEMATEEILKRVALLVA